MPVTRTFAETTGERSLVREELMELLERQRFAMATVRRRRLEAIVAIIASSFGVPTAAFFLPAKAQGPALMVGLLMIIVGAAALIARATRCPVCAQQHSEGGHGLLDTLAFRRGDMQFGRAERFVWAC